MMDQSIVQETERRQQRKHFTALTAGFMLPPFDHSNPTFAAGLDARTKLLEAIKPRITFKPDSSNPAASSSHQSAPQRMTPLQRLNDIAKAEVVSLLMSGLRILYKFNSFFPATAVCTAPLMTTRIAILLPIGSNHRVGWHSQHCSSRLFHAFYYGCPDSLVSPQAMRGCVHGLFGPVHRGRASRTSLMGCFNARRHAPVILVRLSDH